MYPILEKRSLAPAIRQFLVRAPQVACKARAGQFVLVRTDETGERVPLTIADYDPAEGTITLVVQEVGKSTLRMGTLEVGDAFLNVVGPLGNPTRVKHYGVVVAVGGGVGVAPLYPIVSALKQAGNEVISIIGARSRNLLFWEERMRAVSDELIVCTDDGSYGRRALVTEPLGELLSTRHVDRAWAIGPAIMMKFVAGTTAPYGVPTEASLNTIMIDGTGMCGGCRVMVDGEARFACVDGPEFDAHRVDWDGMLKRLSFYRQEEKLAVERWKDHACQLDRLLVEGGTHA